MGKDIIKDRHSQPLVSVIMPAYNAEKYIGAAISSVLSQSYTNWELLVIDDCSDDSTAEIIRDFERADSRIRLLCNEKNMGVAGTRNRGFDIAQGEWVALLDSDDLWHTNKLEEQLRIATGSEADIIYCSYSIIDECSAHISDFIVPERTSYENMLKKSVLSCSTVLMHRSILSQHRFSEEYHHEDYVFWLELLKSGYSAAASRELLADYRIVNGSRSNNKLKSARNRWLIYRELEKLPLHKALSAFIAYAFNGVIKHRRLR